MRTLHLAPALLLAAPALAQGTPIVNPANGHAYQLVDAFLGWNDAAAEAASLTYNGQSGHLVSISDQAELDWILLNLAPSRAWLGLAQNLNSPSYAEPGGGWEWVDGTPFTFMNWFPGEPNDISASGGPEDYAELFGSGEFNDCEEFHTFTNQYIVEWDGGGLATSTFCTAVPNSTGATGKMSATGSSLVTDNDVTLVATDLPPHQFGIFVVSANTGGPIPVANGGNLCLAGGIGRYTGPAFILNAGAGGTFQLPIDLTSIPLPNTFTAAQPGDTWSFQAWYRDTSPASNFTEGLSISFF